MKLGEFITNIISGGATLESEIKIQVSEGEEATPIDDVTVGEETEGEPTITIILAS